MVTGGPWRRGCRRPSEPRSSAIVTIDTLTWLLLPPLVAIALVPRRERGGAATRLIVAAFGLGTLVAGVGELGASTMRAYAMQSAGNALFVSLSAGLVLGAASPWRRSAWPSWASVLVLAAATAWPVVGLMHWGGYLLGAVLGTLPLALGRVVPASSPANARDEPATLPVITALALSLVATALALAEPLVLVLLAPVVPLVWRAFPRHRAQIAPRQLVLPVVAALAVVALGWLALTIAGDPLVRLGTFFAAAPVSPAGEQWLGLLGLVLVLAMLAPWPLHRYGVGVLLAPAATILTWRLAGSVAPDVLAGWQPLVGMALVPLAVIAAWRGRWVEGLGAAAIMVAFRPGVVALIGAALAILAALAFAVTAPNRNMLRPDRVTFSGEWWVAMLAAAGVATTAVAMLQHEVVLATLLAGGLASAAARTGRAAPVA